MKQEGESQNYSALSMALTL